MDISKINKAAEILYNSKINVKRIKKLPKECNPQSLKEAYDIQEELVNKYLKEDKNNSIIGKKIGCTNKAAQAQLNINESFFGNMFLKNISKSECIINSEFFFSPFVEPEFSFIMKEELDILKAPYEPEFVYESILAVLPSIELVDSRFEDWTAVGVKNLIADNAVHAHWIYGDEINNLNLINFNNHSVDLLINEKLVDKGNSNNVMGNPINSLTWLVNNLALFGKSLPKNSYISTGTCTPAIPIKKGDKVMANFGKLGNVSFIYK
ncbi:hypothetical protein OAJ09_01810 [Candidatus Pelagibacter sp.]|nr:hypothetical protein [Candidatus Pelagibacter sp.]